MERVFSQLPGSPDPGVRDDIYQLQFDALSGFGELISDSPLRQILTRDFQVASVSGVCDLSTTVLAGGSSLASANIYSLVVDTIKRGKVLHPDSTEPCQPEKGNTIYVDRPRREKTFGYIFYILSANGLYLKKEDGMPPSDANVTFRCSCSPTFGFFAGTSPSIQELEPHLVAVGVRLVTSRASA